MTKFELAMQSIDAVHAQDPHASSETGPTLPAELIYAHRMTETLARIHPQASELLKLAARAQHIRRWTVPRSGFPAGKSGYHRWRTTLQQKQAALAGEILATCGYAPDQTARVQALIRKDNLRADVEAQALEDTACLVFLEHHFADFRAKHGDAKIIEIVRKTWSKMSDVGRTAALQLPLAPEHKQLIERALSQVTP